MLILSVCTYLVLVMPCGSPMNTNCGVMSQTGMFTPGMCYHLSVRMYANEVL